MKTRIIVKTKYKDIANRLVTQKNLQIQYRSVKYYDHNDKMVGKDEYFLIELENNIDKVLSYIIKTNPEKYDYKYVGNIGLIVIILR